MLSGTLANVAVKIFGDDLHELRRLARQAQAAMSGVTGVVDLSLEQQTEIPTLSIRPDSALSARYGLPTGELASRIQAVLLGNDIARIPEVPANFPPIPRSGHP